MTTDYTLTDYPSTYDGIIRGALPEQFQEIICIGHRAGWHPNPNGDSYIWVCAECECPSRIAICVCVFCATWNYEVDIKLNAASNMAGECPRNDYICRDCRGES